MAGPFRSIGPTLGTLDLGLLLVAMVACYLLVLASTSALPVRWVATAVVSMHVVFAVSPLLLSRDAFLYLAHAWNGARIGRNPYAHAPGDAPENPVREFIAGPWVDDPSIYGPLFTLLSYPLALLGVSGGIWALKVGMAAASLGCAALVHAGARWLTEAAQTAALAFVGLNPVLLVWVVGGAHNDALVALCLSGGVFLAVRGHAQPAAATLVAAGATKVTAGLVLPFYLLGRRKSTAALCGALLATGGLLLVVVVAFESSGIRHLFDALWTSRENLSPQSLPSQFSSVVLGTEPVQPELERIGTAIVVSVTVVMLWRTWRGADWIAAAGWTTLSALVLTVWVRPWYLVWLLPLAALGRSRGLVAATLVLTGFMIMAVPLRTTVPEVLRLFMTALR